MWSGGLATNIVLAGFMGAGKTTVGRLVAHRLGWPFVDADDEIVARAGMSIPEIFARYGEAHFRQIEREVCAELARREHTVIATGGGALVDETNLKTMLASGLVVCLRVSAEAVAERLAGQEGRPVLKGDWRALLERRRPAYDAIPYQIDTTGKSPEAVADEIVTLWQTQNVSA